MKVLYVIATIFLLKGIIRGDNWILISLPCDLAANIFAKISIAILIFTFVKPGAVWRRRFLGANVTLAILLAISVIITNLEQYRFRDSTQDYYYRHSGSVRQLTGFYYGKIYRMCSNRNLINLCTGYSSFLDFIFVLVPLTLLFRQKPSPKTQSRWCVLFSLSIL